MKHRWLPFIVTLLVPGRGIQQEKSVIPLSRHCATNIEIFDYRYLMKNAQGTKKFVNELTK